MALNSNLSLELTLPFPPSVNSYKKVGKIVQTKNKKLFQTRVDTNETKMFYYQVWLKCKALLPSPFVANDRLKLQIELTPPSMRFDIDNPLKVLLDSLTRAKLIPDDRNIDHLMVIKLLPNPEAPFCTVKITRI